MNNNYHNLFNKCRKNIETIKLKQRFTIEIKKMFI